MALNGLYIAFTRDHFGRRKLARCAKHLPIEFYTVVMLLTFMLIIISIPSPLALSFQA